MQCLNCKKEILADSIYCCHCGKLIKDINEESKEKKSEKSPKSENLSKLGLLLFFVALIGFDFILGTIFNALNLNIKIPYIISMIIYGCSVICGIISLYIDKRDVKKEFYRTSNKNYAYVSIVLSVFISLANLTQVILK